MHTVATISITPSGTLSINSVDMVERVFDEECKSAGVIYAKHETGFNVEGDWDAIIQLAGRCRDAVFGGGDRHARIHLALGTRTDKHSTLKDKLRAVQEKSGRDVLL
ncbi:hypothetical protein HDU77_009416 [Chytriomyces hyalinus]|nr:hypothetical protein HDU77_009416 [Chytriomyces hyalinus]